MKNEIMFPVSKLDSLLKKDLLNNNKEKEFAKNHKELIISFLNKKHKTQELKQSLLTVFKSFNKINNKDTLQLNIELNKNFIPPTLPEF